jgi:hypothetical protein
LVEPPVVSPVEPPPPQAHVPNETTAANAAANADTADASLPAYQTIAQLKSIPPCKATVVKRPDIYSMVLRRTPGAQPFIVGGAAGDQEVWHFLATLHGRQTCDLPADFLAFESRKFYPTAQDIAAIPPCKATVIVAAPCYCMFRKAPSAGGGGAAAAATSNEIFVIGDPGSKPLVWRFLSTLEDGQTCDLPAAFLAYQKSHPQADDADQ